MTARWQNDANCRGYPVHWFVPDAGVPPVEARALCAECPVREPCAEEGSNRVGLWGGRFRAEKGRREREQSEGPRPRPYRCDGCERGFLTAGGLRSHQSQKRCGKAYPPSRRVELEREVARFEADLEAFETAIGQ